MKQANESTAPTGRSSPQADVFFDDGAGAIGLTSVCAKEAHAID